MSKIVDLTGYTATVPAGWTATAGYGRFDIGVIINDNDFSTLVDREFDIGYVFDDKNFDVSPQSNSITFGPYAFFGYTNVTPLTIEFINGEDLSNVRVIQWFVDNNATFTKNEPDEPEGPSIQGSAIPGATSYALYEKKNNFYNMLAVSDAINFNLGKLNLSGGTHKLVIRARAEDYEVSDYSNEVSYSIAANLKTFNLLDKEDNSIVTTATYEEGMTWEEFVNSSYNINNNFKCYESYSFVQIPYGAGVSSIYHAIDNEYIAVGKNQIINDVNYYIVRMTGGGSND